MPEPPRTDEGWYALHDFRSIDWDEWRAAPARERERAVREGVDYLERHEAVEDADAGASAVFSVVGHKADLLLLHFRPTLDHLSTAERRFERTALASFTERATSYVSVTEVSGYVSDDYFESEASEARDAQRPSGDESGTAAREQKTPGEGGRAAENEAGIDEGLRRYIEGKLEPEIPDDEYVSFYPMSKRRGEEYNWYDLSFEERAELMSGHGEVGREYAGKIKQVIASSVGFDDFEWGVTLFGADPADIKDIVYEMRFDEASSRYGEFGAFYVGRRFPPADIGAFLAGDPVPTAHSAASADAETAGEARARGHTHGHDTDSHHGRGGGHRDRDAEGHHGGRVHGSEASDSDGEADGDALGDAVRDELADLGVYAGKPHGEDVYATVLYSEADPDELFEEVADLRESFGHYGTHVKTAVYEARERDRAAVVSVWKTASAAETAAGFLSDLPDVVSRSDEESGFGTMGMFYAVKPEHRGEFVEKFGAVGDLLAEIEGHRETDLMENREDENDMFIASQWRSREDAMEFFRSAEFRDTVKWGRDVLADRPRHVFLA